MGMGGGNKAQQQAAEQEKARQVAISQNVNKINDAYSGRESQYNDFLGALQKQYGTELNKQQGDTARNLKFSLARGGLTGGSAAADTGKQLSDEYNKGLITAENKAQGATANLRSQDEQSRMQLISLAQSGADVGNAATQTSNALRASLEGAKATGLSDTIGSAFGDTANIYKNMQEQANLRKGLKYSELYANPFSRGSGGNP